MQTHKKSVLLTILVLSVATITAIATHNQDRIENPTSAQESSSNAQYPVVDYAAQLPAGPEKRALRQTRNSRYDIKEATVDVQQARLKEDSPSVLLDLPISHAPVETAIPIGQSDAIVIGEVTDAQAFLSNDKTSVYSEFTVRIEEPIKQISSMPLAAGGSITAERQGGAVRFPSGKVLQRGALGKNSLSIGRRYVLFLKYNNDAQDYSVITGYELRGGRVFPLDGIPESEGKITQFEAYRNYKGTAESVFLNNIKTEVARLAQSLGEGGRK
ncbi:MAG: hypothetical protein ACR2G4_05950 [Pyrinomonadaceae bacterium]